LPPWIFEAWHFILSQELGLPHVPPRWLKQPAAMAVPITTPQVLARLGCFKDELRPFTVVTVPFPKKEIGQLWTGYFGGNPSWNTGVDYKKQLALSIDNAEVHALYEQAGLDLDADLDTLNNATRISADPAAVDYLSQNIIFNGKIQVPVLTFHTTDDDAVSVQNEQAYADVVAKASNNSLLRQIYVHRGGHCNFTEAETIAALHTLVQRLDTGTWPELDPEELNAAAERLGARYNVLYYCFLCSAIAPPVGVPMAPTFLNYTPAPFLRPFDAFSQGHGSD
jgi:hypothetical protein